MTREDVASSSFTKSRYAHFSNSQRDKAVLTGTIEVLDSNRRVYRLTQEKTRRFFIASSANGSGAVSMEVPKSMQHLIAAEITGLHASSMQ